jgi:hypothetical protein
MSAYTLAARHVEAALAEAASKSIGTDVMGRALVAEAIRLFRQAGRSNADIAAELTASAENLDDDEPMAFMRP